MTRWIYLTLVTGATIVRSGPGVPGGGNREYTLVLVPSPFPTDKGGWGLIRSSGTTVVGRLSGPVEGPTDLVCRASPYGTPTTVLTGTSGVWEEGGSGHECLKIPGIEGLFERTPTGPTARVSSGTLLFRSPSLLWPVFSPRTSHDTIQSLRPVHPTSRDLVGDDVGSWILSRTGCSR